MSNIYLLSLGCDKNRVDGEVMIGSLRIAGYTVTDSPETADAIIINTCGFIADAVQESLNTVFELAEYKKSGSCRALIIVGCMAQRYKKQIKETIPEADAIIGVGEYEKIAETVAGLLGAPKPQTTVNITEARKLARTDSDISHIAYVKIAEGCDNNCTYCTIPQIRGRYKSRPMEEIIKECRELVQSGASEIVLVAQDTARYGTDIYKGVCKLPELLHKIADKSGAEWIRLMYAYPEHITPELINALAEIPQVCKYIDMPIQHSEGMILSKMGRSGNEDSLRRLIAKMREEIPDIAIRTTFMVGFPGERECDFKRLYKFAKSVKFDRMGVFPYSQEEGTPAAGFPQQKTDRTKQKRLHMLMTLQQQIHFSKQETYVGKVLRVIIDMVGDDGGLGGSPPNYDYIGRTQYDAYETDAVVHVSSAVPLRRGQIVDVEITAADEYDLLGVCHESS